MLIQTPEIIVFIRTIKGRLTPVARKLNPGQQLWQRSFYDHGLRKEETIQEIARYIWNNPVRTGIVENPAEYPWSGSLVWPEWRNFIF